MLDTGVCINFVNSISGVKCPTAGHYSSVCLHAQLLFFKKRNLLTKEEFIHILAIERTSFNGICKEGGEGEGSQKLQSM